MDLSKLGWNEYLEEGFKEYRDKGLSPGRIVNQQKNKYVIYNNGKYIEGMLAGKFRYKAKYKKDFPTVGDWVAIQVPEGNDKAIIHGVLKRKTSFVRRAAISGGRKIRGGKIVGGTPEEQVIASNIDTAFIIMGLDDNFNIGRIERYITQVYNSGASPVIILNKMDICSDLNKYISEVEAVAIGLPIHPISVVKDKNMDVFNNYLKKGKTLVFLGSSGVGKSTITNYLLKGEIQKTKTISISSGKGRHTTTSSELLFHSSGAMIIDTPGLRELQLWGDESLLEDTFEDIIKLKDECKFNDCSHDSEPGCAIKQALEDGVITNERYNSYMTQLEELNRVSKERKKAERYHSRVAKMAMVRNSR